MDAHLTLSARANEPQPRAHMGGTNHDVPVLRFGGEHAPACDIHLGRITDLPRWLRSFAAALDTLARQVEDEIPSPAPPEPSGLRTKPPVDRDALAEFNRGTLRARWATR